MKMRLGIGKKDAGREKSEKRDEGKGKSEKKDEAKEKVESGKMKAAGPVSYDKYELSPKEKRDCIVISYICLFFTFYIFYHNVFMSAISGVFVPFCVRHYAEYLAEKRRGLLLEQFRDCLYSLSASFATGRHMRDGLFEARDALRHAYDENSPMIREISGMLVKINESRASEEDVYRDFAKRSCLRDIQSFFDTYFICRKTGGDMNKVVSKASGMLIEKIGIEREIRTLTSQKSFEGKIISAMPIVVIMFLNLVSPDYIEVLYTSFTGRLIMTAAMAGIVYAYHMTKKLTKIEI